MQETTSRRQALFLSFHISEFFKPLHDFLFRLALILLCCGTLHLQRPGHFRFRRVGDIAVGAGEPAALMGAEGAMVLPSSFTLSKNV